ncbi:hypothetical protein [Flavobacterium sp. CS20]|uniref:hypothetical protein n=1 Tax=Flavobacterium sp. CS20 TaxID=2775246 RepID=UPI001B3A3DF7|nr:hypothetical protein [Flavobacterium sp. CS20]QTY27828.1 hypothetical protein IGB25_04735 [Flavobacterium sp. CS20]
MKTNQLIRISLVAILPLSLFSCQLTLKALLGIKDFNQYVTQDNRLEYYEGFLENNDYSLKIYTFKEEDSLFSFLKKQNNFPFIVVNNLESNQKYRISCYEDVSYDVELLNNNNLSVNQDSITNTYSFIDKTIKQNLKITYNKEKTVQNPIWDIYIVSGTFLGKKLQKRTLGITKLNNIKTINIIDMSMEKIEE